MRIIWMTIAAMAFAIAPASAQLWKTYSSEQDGFQADFPGTPERTEQKADDGIHSIVIVGFSRMDITLAVSVTKGFPESIDSAAVFESALKTLATGATIKSQASFPVPGGAGLDVIQVLNTGEARHVRIYFVAHDLYQVIGERKGDPALLQSVLVTRLFDSFRLLAK